MKLTVGFPISHKENENRRALIPDDIKKIRNSNMLFFERSYGEGLGFSDDDYVAAGANIVSREEVLLKDIICDPKIGDADYLGQLKNQTIFGWVHAVQNREITDTLINGSLTAYAWEDMFELNQHVFWRNNEIAGEAAIMHAFRCYGKMPYNTKVALLGRGNVANGALKILTLLGSEVFVYGRKTEELFKKKLHEYDVIVNAVLWDTNRTDHIISREDLSLMKKNSMIIDISCDRAGGIETSIPTTIEDPVYTVNGIQHYVVDHTPSLFFKTATESISEQVARFLDDIIEKNANTIIDNALIIEDGTIRDDRINTFQHRC